MSNSVSKEITIATYHKFQYFPHAEGYLSINALDELINTEEFTKTHVQKNRIDLHGLTHYTATYLLKTQKPNNGTKVIYGTGKHSKHEGNIMKTEALETLKSLNLEYYEEPGNDGACIIGEDSPQYLINEF